MSDFIHENKYLLAQILQAEETKALQQLLYQIKKSMHWDSRNHEKVFLKNLCQEQTQAKKAAQIASHQKYLEQARLLGISCQNVTRARAPQQLLPRCATLTAAAASRPCSSVGALLFCGRPASLSLQPLLWRAARLAQRGLSFLFRLLALADSGR